MYISTRIIPIFYILGKVEAQLKTHPLVENICVYGDGSKSNVVSLVIPGQAFLDSLSIKVVTVSLIQSNINIRNFAD